MSHRPVDLLSLRDESLGHDCARAESLKLEDLGRGDPYARCAPEGCPLTPTRRTRYLESQLACARTDHPMRRSVAALSLREATKL
jgi:hypothetical protein